MVFLLRLFRIMVFCRAFQIYHHNIVILLVSLYCIVLFYRSIKLKMNVSAVKNIVIADIISVNLLRLSCTAFSFSRSLVSIATNRFSMSASLLLDCSISLFMLSFIRSIFSSILSILSYSSSIRFSLSSCLVFNRSRSLDWLWIKFSCMQSYSTAIVITLVFIVEYWFFSINCWCVAEPG